MTNPDAPFVFPDRSLYHGPDEIAGDLRPGSEGKLVAVREFSEQHSFEFRQLRVRYCRRFRFHLGTPAASLRGGL